MKRTRKWHYVEQEATRLANLGLSPAGIAQRIQVQTSTVNRWMRAGKLTDTRRTGTAQPAVETGRTAEEWGKAVRSDYALDATDEELVKMAEAALEAAHDPKHSLSAQMAAMGRFQALVKQLNLVARAAVEPLPKPEPSKQADPPVPQRREDDPRRFLKAVG